MARLSSDGVSSRRAFHDTYGQCLRWARSAALGSRAASPHHQPPLTVLATIATTFALRRTHHHTFLDNICRPSCRRPATQQNPPLVHGRPVLLLDWPTPMSHPGPRLYLYHQSAALHHPPISTGQSTAYPSVRPLRSLVLFFLDRYLGRTRLHGSMAPL